MVTANTKANPVPVAAPNTAELTNIVQVSKLTRRSYAASENKR
jgi:hypothetical protein